MLKAKDAEVRYLSQAEASMLGVVHAAPWSPSFYDRGLMASGAALDELIHERYPSPDYLPASPIQRAQLRMLSNEVRGWYGHSDLVAKVTELRDGYDGTPFYFSRFLSLFDFAAAPVLAWAVAHSPHIYEDKRFKAYAQRVLSQPGWRLAMELTA